MSGILLLLMYGVTGNKAEFLHFIELVVNKDLYVCEREGEHPCVGGRFAILLYFQ